jgi:hypothetical protein
MKDVFRTFAAWFVIWAALIVAVAIGLAALGVLVLALPVMALRRAFTSKSGSRQAGSDTVVEGEYRVVDETEPEGQRLGRRDLKGRS